MEKVLYPGLPSHPQHAIAKKQQHGFGAMITFYCKGGLKEASIILAKVFFECQLSLLHTRRLYRSSFAVFLLPFYIQLRIFSLAESLGAVESLAESPAIMTHASVPPEQRALLGIDDTLIRLSVGIESCGDLVQDLDQALNASLLP